MSNIQIFLSDTHFGVRNNSINWLESQKAFIYNQFIPYLKKVKKENFVRVFHLGDVFDSRSSISPMICKETNKMLEAISEHCDSFTILAGNHDFFSPIEGNDNSTSLEMLPCMWKEYNDINIITKDCDFYDNKALCIPWFEFHNPDKLKKLLHKYHDTEIILTHTDLDHLDPEIQKIVGDKNIITGHIHIPTIDEKHHHYTLGSCFALNYADANSERGFWQTENWDLTSLKFINNIKSIKFCKILNEDILDFSDYDPQDYIELVIKDNLYERDDIQKAIKNFYTDCPHFTVVVEQQNIEIESFDEDLGMYNIVKNACPENLRDKLDTLVESSNL